MVIGLDMPITIVAFITAYCDGGYAQRTETKG
jgi:hypothetical protein